MLEALQISTEVNLALAEILLERYGKSALNTGDEGGYAPAISSPQEALGLLHEAVADAGHTGRFRYGLDCAATHYHSNGTYELAGETRDTASMIELYQELIADFDIVTIEDPLDEEDYEGFAELTRVSGIQIVGDDLFVTNPERLAVGIEAKAANSLLWKVNQIGTLTEALDAAEMAHRNAYSVVVSERSGRDRGSDHRRPRGRAQRRTDQDRRPGPRRADREVQPTDRDRGAARRDRELSRRRLPGSGRRLRWTRPCRASGSRTGRPCAPLRSRTARRCSATG